MKIGTKIRHFDTGIWREGTFQGVVKCNDQMGYVIFDDDPPAPDGKPFPWSVRLDELEEVKDEVQ